MRVALAAAIMACIAAGCAPRAAEPDRQAALAGLTRAASEIHAALPPERPGFGVTDYPGHAEGDVPKAYAMVLLAELDRRARRWRAGEADLAPAAGRWLLDNADSNGDGIVGWGLPVAWDAYDDGSVNPAHTEYTITTAIVIDALLTWAERDAAAPHGRIHALVHAAIRPYLDSRRRSPSGMAPYSLAAADRRWDTFNPAAYLAGQIQRASLAVQDHRERERYLAAADATMAALLKHRRLAPGSGHWYWHYSVQQALPNDLPHAGYVIAGIRAYREHGGRLAAQFDWDAVLDHLGDFRAEGEGRSGEVRAFPAFHRGIALAARSYDLGFALHLACTEPRTAPLASWLLAAVPGYRTPAARYAKLPVHLPAPGARSGAAAVPWPLVVNEYETYLYRGLTACALAPMASAPAASSAPSPATAAAAATPATAAAAPGTGETTAVPLAGGAATAALARRLALGHEPAAKPPARRAAESAAETTAELAVPLLPAEAGIVSFDHARRALLTRADGVRLPRMAAAGVPVKVIAAGAATYVFHRRHPDDRLALLRYDGERLVCRQEIEHGNDPTAVASLRAAALHGTRLHAVVYHNPSQANWHLAWDTAGACPVRTGDAAKLPSLEEPAGPTYEMLPGLHFHVVRREAASGGGDGPPAASAPPAPRQSLWLAGGNLQLEIGEDGPLAAARLPGCRHIVESAPTPAGLAHLCVGRHPVEHGDGADAGARRLVVVAPPGLPAPRLDPAAGVPWRLRWSQGRLQIDHARTAAQLRDMLRRDLERSAPGGFAEFGINNEEGRIPWSQVYYLNGLLDLLDLARRDAAMLELFGPLVREARLRLDLEMQWLDEHVGAGRHHTRAFTIDRSRALFGVQTARLLLLMHRYLAEVPDPRPLASDAPLRRAVHHLDGHIEVLADGRQGAGEEPRWIRPGTHHLRWPRGSKFYFDGMPVPFNHQNEWAYAVLATADEQTPPVAVRAATDILRHFTDRIAPAGTLPASGRWDYWWGRAYDGWTEPGPSLNVRRFGGDRIQAWISFRTIDAMALVSGSSRLGEDVAANARASAQALAARGALYPLANHAWVDSGPIHLGTPTAHEYARVSAPWELANAVWAHAVLARRWRGE